MLASAGVKASRGSSQPEQRGQAVGALDEQVHVIPGPAVGAKHVAVGGAEGDVLVAGEARRAPRVRVAWRRPTALIWGAIESTYQVNAPDQNCTRDCPDRVREFMESHCHQGRYPKSPASAPNAKRQRHHLTLAAGTGRASSRRFEDARNYQDQIGLHGRQDQRPSPNASPESLQRTSVRCAAVTGMSGAPRARNAPCASVATSEPGRYLSLLSGGPVAQARRPSLVNRRSSRQRMDPIKVRQHLGCTPDSSDPRTSQPAGEQSRGRPLLALLSFD